MDMQSLVNMFNQQSRSTTKPPATDTAEVVKISPLSLLKMLNHARAGVPMEVMGLMLGSFVDEYTVDVVDVFAMPQKGTNVSVETIDEKFQLDMTDLLKLTGRTENVVGWYHSHPGFGCWLSGTDVKTHSDFEKLDKRCVAVVIDPIQSVKGKVVIDAFRNIEKEMTGAPVAPRQTTSVLGSLKKPTLHQLIRGLDSDYYALRVEFKLNELETKLLSNIYTKSWTTSFTGEMKQFEHNSEQNKADIQRMVRLAKQFNERLKQEEEKTKDEVDLENVGKVDPKKHLEDIVDNLLTENIDQSLSIGVNTMIFDTNIKA
eukprot:maker-scaffold_9-snap-gene-7.26-mRNA-1 protein AED:0.01 eAED:0.01 QI:111/1/1/1/1/1/3/929/315